MNEFLQKFTTTYQNKNASGQDLIALFKQEAGPKTEKHFEKWLSKDESCK
ncbi:M1 family metallopeptidase [Peribacillus alkalitolerans]|nr:M1 family metallopeptidase [Peribacillus alkalitolerans]